MALTRDLKETILERAKTDAEFRVGLLTEAADVKALPKDQSFRNYCRDIFVSGWKRFVDSHPPKINWYGGTDYENKKLPPYRQGKSAPRP